MYKKKEKELPINLRPNRPTQKNSPTHTHILRRKKKCL